MTRIYKLNQEYRPKLCEFLEDCGFKLMDRKFSYEEVGDISGTIIFHGSLDEYYYNQYINCLNDEILEAIK